MDNNFPRKPQVSRKTLIRLCGPAFLLLQSGCDPKVADSSLKQSPLPETRVVARKMSVLNFSMSNRAPEQLNDWFSEVDKLDTLSLFGILEEMMGKGNLDGAEALAGVLARRAPLELADFVLDERTDRVIGIIYRKLATNGPVPGAVTRRLASKLDTLARRSALKEYCSLLTYNPAAQSEFREILQGLAAIESPYFRGDQLRYFMSSVDKSAMESAWAKALTTLPSEDLSTVVPSVIEALSSFPGKVDSALEALEQRIHHEPSKLLLAAHRSAFSSWLTHDTNRALNYLNSVTAGAAKDLLIMEAVKELCSNGENDAAGVWIHKILDDKLREEAAGYLPILK